MPFVRRQGMGILGMAFAVLGGVVWFFGQYIPAAILWGISVMVLLKLNKKSGGRRR